MDLWLFVLIIVSVILVFGFVFIFALLLTFLIDYIEAKFFFRNHTPESLLLTKPKSFTEIPYYKRGLASSYFQHPEDDEFDIEKVNIPEDKIIDLADLRALFSRDLHNVQELTFTNEGILENVRPQENECDGTN